MPGAAEAATLRAPLSGSSHCFPAMGRRKKAKAAKAEALENETSEVTSLLEPEEVTTSKGRGTGEAASAEDAPLTNGARAAADPASSAAATRKAAASVAAAKAQDAAAKAAVNTKQAAGDAAATAKAAAGAAAQEARQVRVRDTNRSF